MARLLPTTGAPMTAHNHRVKIAGCFRCELDDDEICAGCGHAPHDGEFCDDWSECDEDCGPHPCACDGPGGQNYSEVPDRVPVEGDDGGGLLTGGIL
jgi:hypothetical protein